MLDRERGPGVLVVILLAVFGMFYAATESSPGQGGGEPAGKAGAEKSAETGKKGPAQEPEGQCQEGNEPVRFLCRFFGDPEVKAVPGESGWKSMPWVEEVRRQQISFLIATAPDPQMTRLALYMDRSLSAIQAAVASVNPAWRFDRAWLPWKPASGAGEPAAAEIEQAETLPGLMVFRGNIGESVVVFLIGESPLAGIRGTAFREAVSIIEGLSPKPPREILVAGPNFSGAFPSLRQEIDRIACRGDWRAKFRVVSPNTTVGGAQSDFVKPPSVGTIHFRRVLSRDDSAMDAFGRYLHSHWGGDIHAAFISEGETVFGLQQMKAEPRKDAVQLISPHKRFNFPREISLLRNLYPDAARQTFGGAAAQQKTGAGDLKLRSGGRPTLPVFAEQQTVASYEAQLLQIAQGLDRDGFEIAGLAATDVLDLIYVAGYLRRAAPETRLYLLDADLLLVRATESHALDGTLLLSDFPLVLENRISTSWLSRTPYASRWEMATYNAVRALLLASRGDTSALLEYGDPFNPRADRPPLCLTIVSRDRLWPIATFPESDRKDRLTWEPAKSERSSEDLLRVVRPSRSWSALTAFLSLAGLTLFGLIAAACFAPARRRAEGLEMFCFSAGSPGIAGRAFYLLALVLLLAGLIVIQITPVLSVELFRRDFRLHLYLPVITLIALAAAAARIIALAAPVFQQPKIGGDVEGFELRRTFGALSVMIALGFVFYMIVWAICFTWTSRGTSGESYFRAYRSLDMVSGVSPVLPLLIMGFSLLMLALMHFRRYSLFVREHPFLPNVGGDPFLRRMKNDADPLHELVSWPSLGFKELPFVFVVLIAIPLSLRGHQSLENRSYDWLYIFTLAVTAVLSTQVWLRFLMIWRELKIGLESLESHPLREAISALPPEFSDIPLFGGANRYRTNVFFCRSVDVLRAMESSGIPAKVLYDTPQSQLRVLEEKLDLFLGPDVDVPPDKQASHRSLDHEFCTIAGRLFAWLEPHWRKGRTAREGVKKDVASDAQIALAEEFISLRYATIVRYVMLHLRNLLSFLAGCFFLTVVSGLVYPFRSQHFLGWVATGSMVLLGIPLLLSLLQMDRDPALARLRSKDGTASGARFVLRAGVYALPALIAVLGTHFPGLSRFFGNWMAPALQQLSR
ncbi:MAG: hypothetical protein HXY18_10150 [Bryobacteraceae bacterium]|nr:hypothetical protein [Bryobacteraceae bacterium]